MVAMHAATSGVSDRITEAASGERVNSCGANVSTPALDAALNITDRPIWGASFRQFDLDVLSYDVEMRAKGHTDAVASGGWTQYRNQPKPR